MRIFIFALFALSVTISFGQSNSLSGSLSGNNETRTTPDQNTPQVIPAPSVANLFKEQIQENIQYTFVSNKTFPEFKEEDLENRFKTICPYLIDINITAIDQTIILLLPENHTKEELLKIVKHFNYFDYQVLN